MIRLIALIVPLALDTFAVAVAIGVAGLPRRDRLRLSAVMAGFEMAMPVAGFAAGRGVGGTLGAAAGYLAIAVLVGAGASMLRGGDEAGLAGAASLRGKQLVALGVGVSMDELAIGFTIGLLRLPVLLAVVVIGAQAFLAAQVGMRLGSRLGERVAEGAERLAAIALILLGVALLFERVT